MSMRDRVVGGRSFNFDSDSWRRMARCASVHQHIFQVSCDPEVQHSSGITCDSKIRHATVPQQLLSVSSIITCLFRSIIIIIMIVVSFASASASGGASSPARIVQYSRFICFEISLMNFLMMGSCPIVFAR